MTYGSAHVGGVTVLLINAEALRGMTIWTVVPVRSPP